MSSILLFFKKMKKGVRGFFGAFGSDLVFFLDNLPADEDIIGVLMDNC